MYVDLYHFKLLYKNKFKNTIFFFFLLKVILSERILFNYKYAKFLELIDEKYIMCTEKIY